MIGKGETVATAVSVNHKELKELIKRYAKAKKSLFIWGKTGIGKSETIREAGKELAKELGLEYTERVSHLNDERYFVVIDIRLSQSDPSDLRGIPDVDREKQATVWHIPAIFPRKGYGILDYDELNLSPPLVQASAYQLLLDRRLATYEVPEGFAQIAAGNRLEDRANVFNLADPLKNRFGHCQLEVPSIEDWTKWALTHDIDMRIVGFLNYRRTALFTWDPKLKEHAFATPRSWAHLSALIKEVPSEELSLIQRLASTQVGVGIAGEFATFIRVKERLHEIKYYIDNPEKCDLPDENTELDLVWALITSLAEYYRDHCDKATLGKILELLKRFSEEYAMFTLKLMAATDKAFISKITSIPSAAKLARKLLDYFD